MAHQVKQFDRHVEAVLAALDLMDCFLYQPIFTIKELVELTGMTRNRIMRLIGTLQHKDYLVEGSVAGTYTLGPKLLSLGRVFENGQNLVALSNPFLKALALKTGESASFYVCDGNERVVLARKEGTQAIRFNVTVGQRMELHIGAAGKLLLAYMPTKERKIILSNKRFERYAQKAIIDFKQFNKMLKDIRLQGYAISKGERNPDAFAIAVPVFEKKDNLIGALSIAGPISRFTPEIQETYLKELLKAARLMSAKFGYSK
jgi:DNA-binding IclR family transcriptional regulator